MTIPGRDIPDPELDQELSKTGVPAGTPDEPERVLGGGPRNPVDDYRRALDQTATNQDRRRYEQPATPMYQTRMVNGFAVPDINPQAFQTPTLETPLPTEEIQFKLDELDVWTAAGVAQMGLTEETARVVARRLQSMAEDEPWIRDVINSDYEAAAAMSEADAIASRFLPNFTMSQELYRTAADMYFEAKNTYDTVAEFESFADKERQGNWNITEIDAADLVGDMATSPDDLVGAGGAISYERVNAAYTDLVEYRRLESEAATFLDEIRHEEAESVRVVVQEADDGRSRLRARVTYTDGEQVDIEVQLDPGTKVTQENALRELFYASEGYAHEITKEGALRGPQTLLGRGFELVGNVARVYDRYNGPVNGIIGNINNALVPTNDEYVIDWRSSAEIIGEQNQDYIDRQVQAITSDVGRNDVLLAVTEQALLENGPDNLVLAASENLQWVNAMSEEEFAGLRAEMIDEDELRKVLEAQVDDRTSLKRVLDDSIVQLAEFGAAYDQVLHWFGTHGLALGSFTFDVLSSGDVSAGWDKFKAAWERANEADYLSDYWGWEGSGAAWLDFTGSIVLDPFTWVTPGGKGLLQVAKQRLATQAGAREVLRLPTTQRMAHMITDALVGFEVTDDIAEQIAKATTRDAVKELGAPRRYLDDLVAAGSVDEVRSVLYKGDLLQVSALTYGMSAQEKMRVLSASNYDEVVEAMKAALPANGGTWLMRFDGHVAVRNTAMNISASSRIYSAMPQWAQRRWRQMFQTFRTERHVGLGSLDFMNDAEGLIHSVFHDSADEAAQWLEDLYRTYRDFDRPYEMGQRALLEEADALKKQLNDTVQSVPRDVRAFGRVRDDTLRLEQRVREIDNRLVSAVGDEAQALSRERQIITEGADKLRELRARRTKISNKPLAADADTAKLAERAAPEVRTMTEQGKTWSEIKTYLSTHGYSYDEIRAQRLYSDAIRRSARGSVGARTEKDIADLEAIRALEEEIRQTGVLRASSESGWFQEMSTKFDEYTEARRQVSAKLERSRALSKSVLVPGNRDMLVDYMDRLMAAIGDKLELPVKKINRFGHRVHDWTDVIGEDAARAWGEAGEEVTKNLEIAATRSVWNPKTKKWESKVDEKLLATLKASGAGAKQGVYKLPASGMEIVAYAADRNAPWLLRGLNKLGEKVSATTVGKNFQEGLSFAQRVWTSSVLMTPRTIIRSNLDEPLRHMINFGVIGRTRNRAVGLGGQFGDELVRGTVQGPLQSTIDQLLPGRLKRLVGSNPELANDLAAGFARQLNQPGGFNPASAAAYRIVNPGEKGFVDAGRFWVNGFVGNDPLMQSVWKAIDLGDPAVFYQWWDQAGQSLSRRPHIKVGDTVTKITPQAAYEAGENTLDLLVSHWPDELQAEARRALLRAATTGGDLPPSLLRKIRKPLPGPVADDVSGLMPKAFENFYGAPGARRGSLFAQAQMAENIEILWDAAEANGKLLTAKRVAELTGVTEAEAARWLSTASWEIEYLVNKGGFIRPQQIMEQAYRHARDYANNIMYQTGAGSFFGKKFQKLYPFGRAQMDYNTFFAQKMTDTLEFGLNPTVARTMQTVRHPVRTAQAVLDPSTSVAERVPLGKLGQTWQPSVLGRPIPFNARLIGRYAALFGAGSSQVQKQREADPDARIEPEGPLALIDQASFVPMFPNDTMLIDLGPGLGPLWSGALHFLPTVAGDDDSKWSQALAGVRDIMEALHPALEFDSREYDITSPGDWAKVGYEYFVPESSSSLRGTVENGVLALASAFQLDYQTLTSTLDMMGRPNGWRRTYKSELGTAIEKMLADGNFPILNHPSSDQMLAEVLNTTLRETSQEAVETSANRNWLFFGDINEFDGQYSEHYNGLVEEIPLLLETGMLGDSEAAQLRDLYQATQLEGATTQDFIDYADAAADVLFRLGSVEPVAQSYVITQHPGMVVNLVSGSQCRMDNGRPVGPSEYCEGDGRLNLPAGQTGRDVLEQGRDEGWIEPRSEADIYDDALVRLATAYRRTSTWLWERTTGDDTWRGRSDGASFPKFLKETTYRISEQDRTIAESIGIQLDEQMTGAEIADAIYMRRETWASNVAPFAAAQTPAITELKENTLNRDDETGAELLQLLQNVESVLTDREMSFDEAPLEAQNEVRDAFRVAINRGLLSQEAYNKDLAGVYGDIDYRVPEPPPLSGVDEALQVDRRDIEVIDGDTLAVQLADERVRVRLIGVNAADYSSSVPELNDLALEHRANLQAVLDGAESISFGIWEADQFGTIRSEGGGEVRYLMWLYVDGEPVFNPDAFTFRNPAGVSSTGSGVPVPVSEGEVL